MLLPLRPSPLSRLLAAWMTRTSCGASGGHQLPTCEDGGRDVLGIEESGRASVLRRSRPEAGPRTSPRLRVAEREIGGGRTRVRR